MSVESIVAPAAPAGRWSRLHDWLRFPAAQPGFWAFYIASLCIDFGLCLYFFLYPLFLVEHHFPEQAIGIITSALTAGTLVGTILSGLLVRRIGVRPLLLVYLVAAPVCLGLRTLFLAQPLQIGFSFLAGATMSLWFVCFSPSIAGLTSEQNRGFAFSLFMATGIGSGAAAGVIGGALPGLLQHAKASDGIGTVLLLACACVALAAFGILRFHPVRPVLEARQKTVFEPFLVRFLLVIAIWNFAISFFTPFANVYFARKLGLDTRAIGSIYTASQLLQVVGVLAAPLLYRRVGLVAGIALTQLATGVALCALGLVQTPTHAIACYLLLTALQWMSGPGISTLLMNRISEQIRGSAASLHILVNLASQTAAAAIAGRSFGAAGYSTSLIADAGLAVCGAILLFSLLRTQPLPKRESPTAVPH